MKKTTLSALKASAAPLVLLVAGLSAGVISTPAVAQDYTNVTASGRVVGTDGRAIPGATITVTSNDQGFSRTVTTDSSGAYQIPQLPLGNYTFEVSANGYESYSDAAVSITTTSAANQFALKSTSGAAGEIVVMAGRTRVVDFNRNTTGATIDVADVSSRIPVARDITSVTLLAPGTTGGDSRFGSLPSVNGASVSENVYYVNGLNTTQFRNGLGAVTVPFDFYKSVEVKTGGISAEFGRMTGGVINAVTKSGSNQFHGGVQFIWEPNGLRAKSPNTYASDNDSVVSNRKEMIAELSGPIIKDHLFFYGIYNTRSVDTANGLSGASATLNSTTGAVNATAPCVVTPAQCSTVADLASFKVGVLGTQYIADRNTSPFYGGKLDAVIVDGQRLEATYWNTSGTTSRTTYTGYNVVTNGYGAAISQTVFRSGGENYVFRYTGTFTPWLTLSAAYGVNKNKDTTESDKPNLPSVTDQRAGGSTSIGNTSSNASLNLDKRTFYRADADLNFELFGSHHVRFGYDREDLNENSTTQANGGYQYTLAVASGASSVIDPVVGLPGGTQYATARKFVVGGEFTTRNTAYYIQDSWKLLNDRLLLNLGLRNDQFLANNGEGVEFFRADNMWSPRTGFSFDVFGDNRTKLYGSFSRYYLPVAVNTNVRLAGGELDYDIYYRLNGLNADNTPILGSAITTGAGFEACPGGSPAGTACVVRNDGTVPDTSSVVAANLKPQSTDEFVIGAEQRLGSRVKVGAFFTYTKLNDSLEDAALDQAIVPYCVSQGKLATDCRAIWNGVHQYALINPGRDVVVTLSDPLPGETKLRTVTLAGSALNYPQAERKYKGVTLTFDREWDGVWSLSANYTWSSLRGNIEGGVRSDNAQTDSGLTTAFDLPALVNGTYGYLPNHRRHSFKIYGSYAATKWLTLGFNGTLQSPRLFGCYGRAPASADSDATAVGGLAGRFYGAGSAYCNLNASGNVVRDPVLYTVINDAYNRVGGVRPSTLQPVPRASAMKSDWLKQINLDATLKLPTDAFNGFLRISVFNVFNWQSVTRRAENGTSSAGAPLVTYSLPTAYQAPRSARLQMGVKF